jgi:DNA-binding MarR family transcriptional regulator
MTLINPTDCPYYLISRITLQITSALKKQFASIGIAEVKPAYLGVLFTLWRKDGLKVVALGRQAGLEPSTMTGLIDRMEKSGLVYRNADPNDRRIQRVYLTEDGKAVEKLTMESIDQVLLKIFNGISGQELSQTMDLLKRVLKNAQEADK